MSPDPGVPAPQPAGVSPAPRAGAAGPGGPGHPGGPAGSQPGQDPPPGGPGPGGGADPGAPDSAAAPPDDHRGRAGRLTDAREQVRAQHVADQYRELAKALADLTGNINFSGNRVGGSVFNNGTFNLVLGHGNTTVR